MLTEAGGQRKKTGLRNIIPQACSFPPTKTEILHDLGLRPSLGPRHDRRHDGQRERRPHRITGSDSDILYDLPRPTHRIHGHFDLCHLPWLQPVRTDQRGSTASGWLDLVDQQHRISCIFDLEDMLQYCAGCNRAKIVYRLRDCDVRLLGRCENKARKCKAA